MKSLKRVSLLLALISISSPHHDILAQDIGHTSTNPIQRRNLLRGPDGIEKLSAVVGDVTLSDPEERWGEHDLSSLTSGSDLVVKARISSIRSRLTNDGNSVLTDYELQILSGLKGENIANLKITCRGGEVNLSNGHTAVLHTLTWDHLQVGNEYIFFLQRVAADFSLVGASQGLLAINSADQTVHLLDTDPHHSLALKREVEGINSSAVELAIRKCSFQILNSRSTDCSSESLYLHLQLPLLALPPSS